MNYREFLAAPIAHHSPGAILDGLTTDLAERRPPGAPHSIADIVGHLVFWQEWFDDRLRGRATPMPDAATIGWPTIESGTWPALRDRFLAGLERMVAIGTDGDQTARPVTPALEFPPMAHYTVAEVLMHVATHNSHHLGQIVLLRQLLGAWPPPAGSLTW